MRTTVMQNEPLLTQAELDFIQQLTSPPPRKPRSAVTPRLSIGQQLSELLNHLSDDEQLSLDTYSNGEHLSFPLNLIKDDRQHTRLELSAPLILEQGTVDRPWRLPLSVPLALLDGNDQASELQVLELSSNGMLVRYEHPGRPPRQQLLQLLLPQRQRIQLRAQLIRRIGPARYAYRLHPLHADDEENLRQFLFKHYSARQHPAESRDAGV